MKANILSVGGWMLAGMFIVATLIQTMRISDREARLDEATDLLIRGNSLMRRMSTQLAIDQQILSQCGTEPREPGERL